jgi:hypothetical protein
MALPPLVQRVEIDLATANRQIDALERQLATLNDPVRIPVEVETDQALDKLRRDVAAVDNQTIDVDVDVDGVNRAETEFSQLNRELDQTDSELRQVSNQADRTGRELENVGRRGSSAFSGLGASVVGFVGALAAFQGVRVIGQGLAASISAASDLEESLSKTNVVFGDFASNITEFASTGPQALGLSNAAALEATATFGNLFVALGLSQEAASDLSPDIIQLASDLASFNNIEVGEAVEKLRAGLVGEAEPLRALGVNLTAASTAAKAVELGLAASTAEVSEAAKVQARYALILEQTVTAQGDFARTADGIANTQRTVAAQFENLAASIGGALAPAFANLLEIVPPLVEAIERTLVPALAGLGTALGSVDTDSFVTNLATLPGSITQLTSQFGAGTQALGNAVQVFNAIATLNFDDVGNQFGQLGEDIDSFRNAGVANTALQNLIETLAAGVDPATALEAALRELGNNVDSITLEGFEVLAEQLVDIAVAAGAAPGELRDLGDTITQFGEAAGFSAAGVKVLTDELLGPWGQAMAEASVGDIIAANLAASLDAAGDAASGAAGPLGDVVVEFEALADESERAATNLRDAADALLAQTSPAFAALDAQGKLTEAQEDLAAAVDEFGSSSPEAIRAALDLAEAQSRLQSAAADLPEGLSTATDAIIGLIDDGDVATTTLGGVKDALDELDGITSEARLNILIEAFGNTTAGAFGIFPDQPLPNIPPPPPRDDQRSGGDAGRGGDLNLTFVNTTTNDLLTEAARAAQVVSSVVRAGS